MNGYRQPVGIDKTMHRGPFVKCPACGVSLQYKWCKHCGGRTAIDSNACPELPGIYGAEYLEVHWHDGATPAYCDALHRFVVKKGFWKNILCEYVSSKHLHQTCYSCGWAGTTETESEDA